MMLSRRAILPLPLLTLLPSAAQAVGFAPLRIAAEAIERTTGGRVGIAVGFARQAGHALYRAEERFAMCSTFKLALCAQLFHSAERKRLSLDEALHVRAADMVPHAPITEPLIGKTATLRTLAAAAMVQSDNPATNLILRKLGGPKAFTRWVRTLGDRTTRLDRYEPMMSEGLPGDPRDTTSPAAMLTLVQRLLFGPTLSPDVRQQLVAWMHASETGNNMLRAGLADGWREGNKTGSGDRGIRNTISIITPPAGEPLLLTVYMAGVGKTRDEREAHFPSLARALIESLAI